MADKLRPDELAAFKAAFDMFDKNQDGTISTKVSGNAIVVKVKESSLLSTHFLTHTKVLAMQTDFATLSYHVWRLLDIPKEQKKRSYFRPYPFFASTKKVPCQLFLQFASNNSTVALDLTKNCIVEIIGAFLTLNLAQLSNAASPFFDLYPGHSVS